MCNLIWNVYKYNINSKKIEQFNIFDHWRFKEAVEYDLNKINDKEKFSEELKNNLLYYFWSKYEYEIVITSFPIHIDKKELDRINSDYESYCEYYGHAPYLMYVNPDVGEKIDIYSQIMLNYNIFLDYLWEYKEKEL